MRTFLQTFLLGISIILAANVSDAQKRWSVVGSKGFSTALFSATIAVDTGNTPHVAFIDTANNNEVTVKKYDGTKWVQVGSTGFYAGPYTHVWIIFDDKGMPYVSYNDPNNNNRLVIIVYDGSSWSQVGITGLSVNMGATWGNPLAAGKNGIVYIAGIVSGKAAVLQFDGTSWTTVGTGLSKKLITHASIDVDSKNNPCIAFEEDSVIVTSSGNIILKMMTVIKYTGGGTWQTLGGDDYMVLNAWDPTINFDSNDTAYVSYEDLSGPGHRASMLKYYDTSVAVVGSLRFSPQVDFLASTVDKNNVPYIVYTSGPANNAMTFDGTSWISAGSVSNTYTARHTVTSDSNATLYVAFVAGSKITVMKYDYCMPLPKVNLCAVFTDTLLNVNTVAWENIGVPNNIDSYKIYRGDTGKYALVGAVGANRYDYKDVSANPAASSYRYKLAVLDSCGVETILDSVNHHRSMLLSFNHFINGSASISWSKYEGIVNPVYKVMKSINGGPFLQIASFTMQGSDTTYIDSTSPPGNIKYRIDIAPASPCNSYDKITSNFVAFDNTSVAGPNKRNNISVSPNPAQSELIINAQDVIEHVAIYTITGKAVMSKTTTGLSKSIRVKINDLPAGTYLLKVNSSKNITFIKL